MAYRIDPERALPSELRRLAQEQTEKALEDLARNELRQGTHAARKRLKKIRALLRLFRPLLGELYKDENIRFRDVARDLGPVRDATTLVEALDALEKSCGERFDAVRSGLEKRREQIEREAAQDERIARSRHALETALAEILGWRLLDAEDTFPTGLKLTYKKGRAALRRAQTSGNAEQIHEWRKRAKYHRYHCRLLVDVWERPLNAREREAHDLTDLTGAHHDLSELEIAVQAEGRAFGGGEQIEKLLVHSAQRRAELEAEAFRLGAKLYAEKPKRLLRRMEDYWQVALG